MYMKKRLQEINERLGATISELGLRPKLEVLSQSYHLFFQRTEDGIVWRSPVSFIFDPPNRTGKAEATWDNVRLGLAESDVMAVGSNGWVQYMGGYDDRGYTIGKCNYIETWEKAFELAADGLRRFPLLPEGTQHPFILDDGEMGNVWLALEEICLERGIDEVLVGRDDDRHEYFEFDYEGVRFHLVEVGFEIQMLKDGVVCHVVKKYKGEDFAEIIAAQLDLVAGRKAGL